MSARHGSCSLLSIRAISLLQIRILAHGRIRCIDLRISPLVPLARRRTGV
jgi:hypothetical protein